MSSSVATSPAKIVARAASIHIDNACNAFMHDCFRQFGIHVVALAGDPAAMFSRQKFEACVLRLYDPQVEAILKAARSSSSNKNIVIYGIARNAQEALRYSSYGINAIFDERSEEHTSELQSRRDLVCRLLLEKKKISATTYAYNQ